jgi:uncharacterized membrane protein YfcA
VIAVATSIVSGVMGLAGGMMLLAAMLHWMDPLVAIPVHGIVQLVSNASRAWFQRAHVRWDAVWRFAWPLLPAGAAGLWLLRALPAEATRAAIGAFVLLATWAPRVLQLGGRAGDPRRALPVGGALVGFLGTTIGATGPLLAPFVLALGLAPPATVGTIAACQIFQHASKVALFGAGGFDFRDYALPALALCTAAIAGSAIGARLLDHLPQRAFRSAVKLVLTALALQLVLGTFLAESPNRQERPRPEGASLDGAGSARSLVAEGLDRIEARGLPGRVEAEGDADQGAGAEGERDHGGLHQHRPVEARDQPGRGRQAGSEADQPADP